jgi:hypothetical protein
MRKVKLFSVALVIVFFFSNVSIVPGNRYFIQFGAGEAWGLDTTNLYTEGVENIPWVLGFNYNSGIAVKDSNCLRMNTYGPVSGGCFSTFVSDNPVDLTNYGSIEFDFETIGGAGSAYTIFSISSSKMGDGLADTISIHKNADFPRGTVKLNVSSKTGSYYIKISSIYSYAYTGNNVTKIFNIKLVPKPPKINLYTEGVENIPWASGYNHYGNIFKDSNCLRMNTYGPIEAGCFSTFVSDNPIDLTNYGSIEFDFETTGGAGGAYTIFSISSSKMGDSLADTISIRKNADFLRDTVNLDISSKTGLYYIKVSSIFSYACTGNNVTRIYNIKLLPKNMPEIDCYIPSQNGTLFQNLQMGKRSV